MSYGFEGFGGGFADPLIDGNGNLIVPAIQSPNFNQSAQTGWAILQNGDAYFYDVTATGTITGASVIVDGTNGGVFIYSGTPAHGNLIVSITGAAGTDAYGNTYPAGLDVSVGTISGSSITGGTISGSAISGGTVTGAKIIATGASGEILGYTGTPAAGNLIFAVSPVAGNDGLGNSYDQGITITNGSSSVVISETGGSPIVYLVSGRSQIVNSSAIQAMGQGSGTSGFDQIDYSGAEDNTQLDTVGFSMTSSSSDGTALPLIKWVYKDPSGTFHQLMELNLAGVVVSGGSLYAVTPGTGTSRTNVATAETWHNMVLTSSFTTNAQDQAPRYRLEGIGGGVCRIDGVAYTVNASTASGTTIATLPVGYRPTIRKRGVGITNYSGYTTPGGALFQVLPTGAVVTAAASTAAGNQLVFDGFSFPVD